MENYAKSLLMVALVLIANSCTEIANEENSEKAQWYKGNLHTHSLWSDGDDYPEMIMGWYKENNYDFIGLSDHNILQEGEKWVTVPDNPIRRNAFQQYLTKWGADWVEHKEDTAGLQVKLKTLEEYRSEFEEAGKFLIIKCEEVTSGFEGKPVHLNATNIQTLIEAKRGESVVDVLQKNIDALWEQRAATQQPMIIHINHPNFGWGITAEDMMQLDRLNFFEVYNGHPAVNNYGDSTRIGTEEMWDLINIHFLRQEKPILYGLAVDDSHNYHNFGRVYSNAGRGWVMVKSNSLAANDLITALEAGEFYSTSGVLLKDYTFDGQQIDLEVAAQDSVSYEIQFIGAKNGASTTQVLKQTSSTTATYEFTGDEQFVRAKITSDKLQKNPFKEGEVEVAWTQPEIYRANK